MGSIASPRDLSGLTIWFDADSPTAADITVTDGKVTQWISRQPVSGTKPTLVPTVSTDYGHLSDTVNQVTGWQKEGFVYNNSVSPQTFNGFTYAAKSYTKVFNPANGILRLSDLSGIPNNITIETVSELNNKKVINFVNSPMKYTNINTFFNKPATSTFSYVATYFIKLSNDSYPFSVNNRPTTHIFDRQNFTGKTSSFMNNSVNRLTLSRNTGDTVLENFNGFLRKDNWAIYNVVYDNIYNSQTLVTTKKRKYYLNGINIFSGDVTGNATEPVDFNIDPINGKAAIGSLSTQIIQTFNTKVYSNLVTNSSKLSAIGNLLTGMYIDNRGDNKYVSGNIEINGWYRTEISTSLSTYRYIPEGMTGSIAEIIFYNEYKTADDLRKVNEYLLSKWSSSAISALPTQPPQISQLVFFENKTLAQNIEDSIEPLFLTNNIQIFNGPTQITDIANIVNGTTYNVRYEITSAISGNFNVIIRKIKPNVGEPVIILNSGTTINSLSHSASDGTATGLNYRWYFDMSSTIIDTTANPTLTLRDNAYTGVFPTVSFTDTNYGTFTYDLTPTYMIRLDRIIPQSYYLINERHNLEIKTGNLSNLPLSDLTYQWLKNNIPIVGATLPTYSVPSSSSSDSGIYRLEITYNGVAYLSNSTTVDIISVLPSNIQRQTAETLTLSIQPIQDATYAWFSRTEYEGTQRAVTNGSGASITVTDYGIYQVRVTKNGFSLFSNECTYSTLTSVTFDNQITNTINFTVNQSRIISPIQFVETTPDGRFLFVDSSGSNGSNRTLYFTEPNYVNRTTIDTNIQLNIMPFPAPQSSGNWRITAVNGVFLSNQAHNQPFRYLLIDGLRSYSNDGKYMAIVLNGTVRHENRNSNSTGRSFVQIYKLEGNSITPVQTIILGYLLNGTLTYSNRITLNTNSSSHMCVAFSGDGNRLFVTTGTANLDNTTIFVFNKNLNSDTWGNPMTDLTNPSNLSSNYTIVPSISGVGGRVFQMHSNFDGSKISFQIFAGTNGSNYNRLTGIFRFNPSNNLYQEDTTLINNLNNEYTTKIRTTIDITTTSYVTYFTPDNTKILLYQLHLGNILAGNTVNVAPSAPAAKQYNGGYIHRFILFSYNSSTEAVSLLTFHNSALYSQIPYSLQFSRDCNYFIETFNHDNIATKKFVYKFLNYYSHHINSSTGQIDLSIANKTLYLNQFVERSAIQANNLVNGWIHNDKVIFFSPNVTDIPNANRLTIRNISYNIPSKPTITDTSPRELTTQDERTTGSNIPIHNLLNNITRNGYFNGNQNGILLRIANNKNQSGTKVASWRFYVDYQMNADSNTAPIEFSSDYSSTGQDLWYIFCNTNGTNAGNGRGTSPNPFPYLRLDMDPNIIFNNDYSPNSRITLEYKLWNGVGLNMRDNIGKSIPDSQSTRNFSAFFTDGSLIRINDLSNSPFSNETGLIQIKINNVIKAPDPFGKFYTPLATLRGTNQYEYTYNILKNSLDPLTFTMDELINLFRPTMSYDSPVSNIQPTYYADCSGGLCIVPRTNQYLLQVSNDEGRTWNYLTHDANPNNTTYFFSAIKNYRFRFRSLPTSSDTGTNFSIFIFPWNGVESTTLNILEFDNPNSKTIASNIITSRARIGVDQVERGDASIPRNGRFVTGDTTGSIVNSGIKINIIENTRPIFKSTSTTFPIKTVDNDGNIIDAFIYDDDKTGSFTFTPNDLFYGFVRNGARTSAVTLVPGTSSSSICDVIDPDISGDQQILGIFIPRNPAGDNIISLGTWSYSVNNGSTWTLLKDESSNGIRFWSFNKNDNRIRLRFVPNVIVETPTVVTLPFYLYDGSDFIPYSSSATIQSTNYDINAGLFEIFRSLDTNLTSISNVKRYLSINLLHRNNAPVLNISINPLYTPLVSDIYSYNSDRNVNFNNNRSFSTRRHIEDITYTTTYTNVERTTFTTTSNVLNTKNALRLNIADVVNSNGVVDAENNDPRGFVIHSGDFTNVIFRVYYTNDTIETLTNNSISITNALHIPNYIRGNTPYSSYYDISSQTFMTTTNIFGWLNPANVSYTSNLELSGNEIMSIRDSIQSHSPNTYFFVSRYENSPRPFLIPNAIHGLPIIRYTRSRNSFLTPLIGRTKTYNIFHNSYIIVERPASTDTNGFNAIIGDDQAHYYFGYINHNTIQLSFRNAANQEYNTIRYTHNSLIHNGSKVQTPRIWTIYLNGSNDRINIRLNGRLVAESEFTTKPNANMDRIPRLGGNIWWENINRFYDGDICDLIIFNSGSNGLTLTNIQLIEQYMASTWLNPQIYIQPTLNQTVDLSYNFYLWDRINENSLTTNYGNVSTRGGETSYSVNGSKFTIKIKKANSRPVLSMNTSTTDNTAILPSFSNATKLAFKLNDLNISTQVHDFTLISIFDDIIRTRYTDEDLTGTPPDVKGLAITNVDNTLGTWSVVKSDNSVEALTGISTTNAYLIKRDTTGNKLRLTLNSTSDLATNRFHRTAVAGLPGTTFFQAIGWDSTRSTQTEYQRVNLTTAGVNDTADVENPFSILNNGVFEFRATTRPSISGSTQQKLFVYNNDPTLNIITPMNFINQFNISQITSGSRRIDIHSIDNLNPEITLQYQDGSLWTDIVLPLTTPINGNFPIRVKESTADKAVNQTFSLLMALYDPGTTLYSPNFGSINIQVQEANLPPSIQINTNATTRTRISNITSSTITYETIFNDIGNGLLGEEPPLFDFRTYSSFNSNLGIRPILWTDTNKSSNLKINAFALEIVNALNGRFYYQNADGDFKDITVSKPTDRFLLASANTLKYIPTAGNSGKAIICLYAWDGVQGTIGTPAEMNSDGTYTQGAFSSSFITLEFPVIPRNNAPTFTTDNKLFPSVFQQTDTNEDISGVSIKSIIDNLFSKFEYNEANSVNEKGFVIIDASGVGLGTWQASTNSGTSWSTAAPNLHLLADASGTNHLRFQFNTNRPTFPNSYSEIPFVRVAAWDKTNSVANGQIAIIDTSGGPTAYSSETIQLGATISHRNHAPTLTAGITSFSLGSVNANASIDISYQTILTAIGSGILSDPDIGDTIGIKITDISFNNTPSANVSMGTWSYTDTVLNGQYVPIGSAGAELMPNRNPVLRFQADKYVYGTTTLTFRASDGELTSSNSRTLSLTVNDINYAPTFTNTQDISYNVVFDVSRNILVSSIISALNPLDRNHGTSYGIVLSASSFDSAIAMVEYSLNPNGSTPIYNTISNSRFGSSETAIHLPSTAAIRYTPRLNQPFSNSLHILLWDRSNNSAVVAAAGNSIPIPIIRNEFSPYSAESVKLIFNHQQVNFAPTITNSSFTLQRIFALETTNTFPVSDLLTTINWADRNGGDRAGLVIIGVDICGGLYEYTIDDGATWTPLPSNLSATSGLHFDNVSASAIRYRSTRNTTDFSTFTVVGWDQTTAVSYGTIAAIPSTRGGNTSYSSNTHTFRVEQTHVNSRPLMTAGNNTTTTAVNYNPTDYTWFQFSDYIPVSSTFTDPDYTLVRRGGVPQVADKTFGILITSVDTSGGSWLISSDRRTVTDITNVTDATAIIASPADYFALRTSKNNPLTFKLTYKAWDKSSRTTTTTVDTTDPNNTSYSENSGVINIPVLHVNTPPTINSDISGFQAPAIVGDGDDNPNPTGFTVASIIDDLVARDVYVDPDTRDWGYTTEPTGLIVVGSTLTTTSGTWSYSTNGGLTWTSIPTSGSSRLHLTYSANNRIRYRPSNNANGSAVLRIAAWDQSNGVANGTSANVTSSQRTDALTQSYSVNETSIRVPTVYLNHAPQFTTLTYTMPEVEFGNVNAGRAWTNIFTSLGYTDKDSQDPQGLVVDSITIPPGLTGVFQVQSGTSWTNVTTGLQFTLSTYSSLRFAPAANIIVDELIASITIRPFDGQLIGSTTAMISVPVIKALFSPTISATLPANLVVNFRADNRLTPLGGVSQGVTITKLLNDMGFTDNNVGEARGMAIQSVATRGTSGFFEVKLGNGPWLRLPTIPRNNYYLLAEFTGSVVNRIRFNSTTRNQTGTASITFFGWDLSDVGPGTQSGSLKQYTQQPVSFSARNGTYRMNIQRIVGR